MVVDRKEKKKFPIDKIIVMTLDRSVNRQWAFMGASAMMNIDPSFIHFAIGKDNLDFDNNMHKVGKAADKDGFSFVVEYARGMKNEYAHQTAASVCQVWNYCRILRFLYETNQTALILFDDKMINVDFIGLMTLVGELQSKESGEFYAAQLMLRGTPDVLKIPSMTPELRNSLALEAFNGLGFGDTPKEASHMFFQEGMSGYDESIVFSPEGANWFLNCLNLSPDFYIFLDHFICFAMPMLAQQAVNRKKGVFCPSEVAYKFVREIADFKTTTDWATKGGIHYENSKRDTTLNYLFDEPKAMKSTTIQKDKNADLQQQLQKVLK